MRFRGLHGLVVLIALSNLSTGDGMNTRACLLKRRQAGAGRPQFTVKMSLDWQIGGLPGVGKVGASARSAGGVVTATFNGSCSAANRSLMKPARWFGGSGLASA